MRKGSASNFAVSPEGSPALATAPVSMMTAVSSTARPMARITPPRIPGAAEGISRCRTTCPCDIPRAEPLTYRRSGRASRADCVARTRVGSTRTARHTDASSRQVVPRGSSVRRRKRISTKPNSPITMEGIPARTSTASPMACLCRGGA